MNRVVQLLGIVISALILGIKIHDFLENSKEQTVE